MEEQPGHLDASTHLLNLFYGIMSICTRIISWLKITGNTTVGLKGNLWTENLQRAVIQV